MPTRSYAQQIGDIGQALVESWFEHPRWVARKQSHDFGIDLEAELAVPIEDHKQRMTGKLIKVHDRARAGALVVPRLARRGAKQEPP